MGKLSVLLGRAVAIEVVAGFIAGYIVSTLVGFIPNPFQSSTWITDTHYHSDLEVTHMAVKHQSNEGHWLNIVCNLPDKHLDISVKIEDPPEYTERFDGSVHVTHRVGLGQLQYNAWVLNDKESLVFAPRDIGLAQQLLRSNQFYFYGQFEPHGKPYIATFELRHMDDDPEPIIVVLTACEQSLSPITNQGGTR